MYLKYRTKENLWGYIFYVEQIEELSPNTNKNEVSNIIEGDSTQEPLVLKVTSLLNGDKVFFFNVKEVYLCNETTGSTVEVLRKHYG
jgi:viroplasmin and RNaseH domain-containing protein